MRMPVTTPPGCPPSAQWSGSPSGACTTTRINPSHPNARRGTTTTPSDRRWIERIGIGAGTRTRAARPATVTPRSNHDSLRSDPSTSHTSDPSSAGMPQFKR